MSIPDPTSEETTAIESLDPDLQQVFHDHRVHYKFRARFATMGYTALGDFVELFDDKPDLKRRGPAMLGYAAPAEDATPEQNEFQMLVNVRLAQAWETAAIRLKHSKEQRATFDSSAQKNLALVVTKADREAMRLLWAKSHDDIAPSVLQEGSQHFTGLIVSQLLEKSWGFFSNRKAVSRAEEHVQRASSEGRTQEGYHKDMETELALHYAANLDQLKDRSEVIITTTTMVGQSMPHIPHIQAAERDIRDPFKFLFGKSCLGRYPLVTAPFASNLMDAMLKQIATAQLDGAKTFKEALRSMKDDSILVFEFVFSLGERHCRTLFDPEPKSGC